MRRRAASLCRAGVLLLAAGCATGAPPAAPGAVETAPLPPVPERAGPPAIYVAYPDSLARIAVSDSNFLFGTTGTGRAELTVNGRPVPVEANGAFLAWLPVPERAAGDTAAYRLVARSPEGVDSLVHRILLPARPGRGRTGAWIDSTSVGVLPERWALPGEEVRLGLRAAPGMTAWVAAGGLRRELREVEAGRYEVSVEARELGDEAAGGPVAPWSGPSATAPADELASPDTIGLRFTVAGGGDTAAAAARLPLRLLDRERPPSGTLVEAVHPVHGRAGWVAGRPTPHGSYPWLFAPGSGAPIEAREGDRVRVRMTGELGAWIAAEDVRVEAPPPGAVPVAAPVGGVAAVPSEDGARIRIAVERRLLAHVRMEGPRSLVVVVPGGLGETERMVLGPEEAGVRSLAWDQLPDPRWELRVETEERIWGWRLSWAGADSTPPSATRRGTLLLDVRRPPRLDPDEPLRGVRVAVDPGHPPAGAEGPTGLTEAEANLAIARRLAERLREAGAIPLLVREDSAPVGLYERRRRAREAGAHLLVSLHNNALPDGVRPFGAEGTSTYYFHPHALPLARSVQRGMLAAMGLRDLGVRWGNLALPRESWMPTVLAEGAFMMIPRHEAALRTRAFRDAYVRGVEAGLRAFLREAAREPASAGSPPPP